MIKKYKTQTENHQVQGVNFEAKVEVGSSGRGHAGQSSVGHGANLEKALSRDSVAAGVGHVIEEPQDAVRVHPPVGSGHGPVRMLLFLAILTAGRLESEDNSLTI